MGLSETIRRLDETLLEALHPNNTDIAPVNHFYDVPIRAMQLLLRQIGGIRYHQIENEFHILPVYGMSIRITLNEGGDFCSCIFENQGTKYVTYLSNIREVAHILYAFKTISRHGWDLM